MNRLPRASRSWTCPYFLTIVVFCVIAVIASLASNVHFTWHVLVPLVLFAEVGWLVGRRDPQDACDVDLNESR